MLEKPLGNLAVSDGSLDPYREEHIPDEIVFRETVGRLSQLVGLQDLIAVAVTRLVEVR